MGGLQFHMADAYPNMGFSNTQMDSVTSTDDQHALVDNQAVTEQYQVTTSPATHKRIWIVIIAILVVAFGLGGMKI